MLTIMRTTLDLDDDVLKAARALSAARRQPMGKIVSDLARRSLEQDIPQLRKRGGVLIVPKRPGAAPVTDALINRLREDEGI